MKKLTLAILTIGSATMFSNMAHADMSCADFASQTAAQKYYNQASSSQKRMLDASQSGKACANHVYGQAKGRISEPANPKLTYSRSIAGPNTILSPLPTSVLLMKKPSTSAEKVRAKAFCLAYKNALPETASVAASSKIDQNIIATRWLVKNQTLSSKRCDSLIANYDYARAKQLMNELEVGANRGPFLVAVVPGSTSEKGGTILVDLSTKNNSTFNQAIAEWTSALDKATNDMLAGQTQTTSSGTGTTAIIQNGSGQHGANNIFQILSRGFWDFLQVSTRNMPLIGSLVEVIRSGA